MSMHQQRRYVETSRLNNRKSHDFCKNHILYIIVKPKGKP